MAALVYLDYLIVVSSHFDLTKSAWNTWVAVYWGSKENRESKILDCSINSFNTKDEAERHGIELSKAWIDRKESGKSMDEQPAEEPALRKPKAEPKS